MRTFTPFSRLPIELRVRVWGELSFFPRNVEINTEIAYPCVWWPDLEAAVDERDHPRYHPKYFPYKSRTSPPALLSVNRES
jgi:hypothetical protein